MVVKPPIHIQTERLSLRPIAVGDLLEIYEKWGSNAMVAKYMSWKSGVVEQTQQFLRYAVDAWDTGEEYTWVIEEKNKPGLIGSFGLRVHNDDADFGYLLMPEYWGKGYIAEAGKPIIDWCYALPHIKRIWAAHHVDNSGSGRVMQKLGLTQKSLNPKSKIYPQISDTELQDEYLYSLVKL